VVDWRVFALVVGTLGFSDARRAVSGPLPPRSRGIRGIIV
jgi:hypothetical protein